MKVTEGLLGMSGPGLPTEVLCLLNMVMPEELTDEEEYEVCKEFFRFIFTFVFLGHFGGHS